MLIDPTEAYRTFCLVQLNYLADCSLEILDDPSATALLEVGSNECFQQPPPPPPTKKKEKERNREKSKTLNEQKWKLF